MAKKKRSKKKKGKKSKTKGHIPLPILEKRFNKLGRILQARHSDYYAAKD